MDLHRRAYLVSATASVVGLSGCLVRTANRLGGSNDDHSRTGTDRDVSVETVASGLEVPWGVGHYRGDLYVTERPGRIVRLAGGDGQPETIVDAIDELRTDSGDLTGRLFGGEGGLLGLVFHPSEPLAYTYQTYEGPSGVANRLVRHELDADWRATPILEGIPGASIHNGGRLLVDETDDALYVTCGDANQRPLAQDRTSLAGKVLRVTFDGDPHPSNPFDNEVFSYGHRNPQGLALSDGDLFSTEHGPDVDDEVNVLEAGNNYGWPEVTGSSDGARFTDPVASFSPPIAPGSAVFYPSDGAIEAWRGDLFFGTLVGQHLHRVRLRDGQVVEQERLFEDEFGRLRTAFLDSDGHLCVTTSNRDGRGSPSDDDDRILRFRPGAE
ncbi:Glucose/arabinose dehydrogenase, beta-propeller fold [Halogranum rubrum]|uniref:Glucose/arabinose dehydrogenase, beta-propeller fold n=1 Tax=Halogranum rubrum TaxID=553466 RepID=A0A1I4EKU2_9EURY|nr:PQQ-dependent sugar dehydrogenase [Halogranum rubrum]SFL06348.1 Glucose/arabinose dehydrogenase, beta-propeller fold [Halogranum rubrum]